MDTPPFEVAVQPLSIERFEPLIGKELLSHLLQKAARVRQQLGKRTVWNINSTAAGGGVAEMLLPLIGYGAGLQIPVRWLILQGDLDFFKITKRLHNGLHGSVGDGGLLGIDEIQRFTAISEKNAQAFREIIQPSDIVILHDPQTAGLVKDLKAHGAHIIWRCHIGHDSPNEMVERSWAFLQPFLSDADLLCFTRATYAPDWVDPSRRVVLPPSIDPFSPKNQEMDEETARSIVEHLGIIATGSGQPGSLQFRRGDGSVGEIKRHADILHAGRLPTADVPLIVQVSRWDRLKDMVGVMRGFSDYVADHRNVSLALVGPNVHGVTDDPEGATVYQRCVDIWRELPHFRRNRVQLVTLPTRDVEENAAMVNAIQRHATILVQKSLYEGFGLTVTEAMWKGKPVVASAVGGILDQIEHRKTGMLIHDPTSLTELGEALCELLANPTLREELGSAGHEHALQHFLATRHLDQYAELLFRLL